MKNTARKFLKVQKILSVVFLIVMAVAGLITLIVGIVTMAAGVVAAGEDEAARTAAITAGGGMIGGGIGMMTYIIFGILGIVFGRIAANALETSKTREEARKGAILGIVGGALCGIFGIPGGIIMLVMKDEDYAEGAQEAKAEVVE